MPQASDYDRYYHVLGLDPGCSLREIEASWKLHFSASHPDKFAADSKGQATSKAQEINNARDELRQYWRAHGKAPPTNVGHQSPTDPPHRWESDTPPPAGASTPEPKVKSGFHPQATDRKPASTPAPRAVLPYSAAVILSVLALVGSGSLLKQQTDSVGQAGASVPAVSPTAKQDTLAHTTPPLPGDGSSEQSTGTGMSEAAHSAQATGRAAVATAAQSRVAPAPIGDPQTAQTGPQPGVAKVILTDAAPGAGGTLGGAPPAAVEAASAGAAQGTATGPPPGAADTQPYLPPAGSASGASNSPPTSAAPTDAYPAPPAAPSVPPRVAYAPPNAAYGVPGHPRDPAMMAAIQAAKRACRTDLQTFCAGIQFGAGHLAQCLRQHFGRLSSGCSDSLLAVRAARQKIAVSSPRH